jgi:hypothetical protein
MALAVFTSFGWSWFAWSTIGTSMWPCPLAPSPPKARDATVATASSNSAKVGAGKPSRADPIRSVPAAQVGATRPWYTSRISAPLRSARLISRAQCVSEISSLLQRRMGPPAASKLQREGSISLGAAQ